jgi:outer membrane exchange protein TraA
MRTTTIFAFATFTLTIHGQAFGTPMTISGDPVAPPQEALGTGLCMASSISPNPGQEFGFLTKATFNGSINWFMEAHAADRQCSTVTTGLDLSNNNDQGLKLSYGDFINSTPGCGVGGCSFLVNDANTGFASRLRGYMNIKADLVNKELHLGVMSDDAASVTLFDNQQTAYPVTTRPPEIGLPAWRVTQTVTFVKPGLYPIEILYAEIAEHAALEVSFFIGPFTDFELPFNSEGSKNLAAAGFMLVPPTMFFQTESGVPSALDITTCTQCDRAFAGKPGQGGCPAGSLCNSAGLCGPCDTAQACGPSCSPCGADAPVCGLVNGTPACVCGDGDQCGPDGGADGADGGAGGAASSSTGAGGDPADGGCSCRASGVGSEGGVGVALIAAGLAFLRRRGLAPRARASATPPGA